MDWRRIWKNELFSAYTTLAFFAVCAAVMLHEVHSGRSVPLLIVIIAPIMFIASVAYVIFTHQDARRAKRFMEGLCPDCGYDLRGQTDRCPECGREIPKPPPLTPYPYEHREDYYK